MGKHFLKNYQWYLTQKYSEIRWKIVKEKIIDKRTVGGKHLTVKDKIDTLINRLLHRLWYKTKLPKGWWYKFGLE